MKRKHSHNLHTHPEIPDKPLEKIIYDQVDIKRGQFTMEELDTARKALKADKATGLDKIPPIFGRLENLTKYEDH